MRTKSKLYKKDKKLYKKAKRNYTRKMLYKLPTAVTSYGGTNKVYKFKQTIPNVLNAAGNVSTPFIQQTTIDKLYAGAVLFSDFPNAPQFVQLFDQFRIDWVKLEIMPLFNMNENYGTTSPSGRLLAVVDFDNTSLPSNLSVLRQYDALIEVECTKKVTLVWKPTVNIATIASDPTLPGTFLGTSRMQVTSPWIDCAYATYAAHCGVKMGVTQTPATTQICKWDIKTTIYFSCRNVI